jgi:geranylgeranylglycerol-phosphate geranylgeranyltransferase
MKPIIRAVVALSSLTRFVSVLLVGCLIYSGFVTVGTDGANAALVALPFMLCVAAGGALNDFFDRQRDAVDKPWRAIPVGAVSPPATIRVGVLLLVAATCCAAFSRQTAREYFLLGFAIAGVVLYNVVVRYVAILKTIHTGALCALPVALVVGRSTLDVLPFTLAVALYVCGREILMDILDIEGDRAAGSRTLPLVIGGARASILGCAFQLIGLFVFAAYALFLAKGVLLYVQLLALASGVLFVLMWLTTTSLARRRVIYSMWGTLAGEMVVLVGLLK